MKIIVLSRRQVENLEAYQQLVPEPHLLISIGPGEARVAKHPNLIGQLNLWFEDIDSPEVAKRNNLQMMTLEDAELVLSFIEMRGSLAEAIVCQCEAGISRSAGVASALALILNGHDSYFTSPNGGTIPNRFVYSQILKVFSRMSQKEQDLLRQIAQRECLSKTG